jgi:hypothetical protein
VLTFISAVVHLEFSGPFSWLASDLAPSIFEAVAAQAAGIYLWTVDTPDGHLIYYVGETGVEFRQRLHQHLSRQLAGMYHIYEPGMFAVGQKHALWRGMYGRDRESSLAALVDRLPTLAPALADFVRLMRFHLAPLTCQTRLRRRIEAALARHLSRQPGLVGSFQDAGIRYAPRARRGRACRCPLPVLGGAPQAARTPRGIALSGASPRAPAGETIRVYYARLGVSDPTNT